MSAQTFWIKWKDTNVHPEDAYDEIEWGTAADVLGVLSAALNGNAWDVSITQNEPETKGNPMSDDNRADAFMARDLQDLRRRIITKLPPADLAGERIQRATLDLAMEAMEDEVAQMRNDRQISRTAGVHLISLYKARIDKALSVLDLSEGFGGEPTLAEIRAALTGVQR